MRPATATAENNEAVCGTLKLQIKALNMHVGHGQVGNTLSVPFLWHLQLMKFSRSISWALPWCVTNISIQIVCFTMKMFCQLICGSFRLCSLWIQLKVTNLMRSNEANEFYIASNNFIYINHSYVKVYVHTMLQVAGCHSWLAGWLPDCHFDGKHSNSMTWTKWWFMKARHVLPVSETEAEAVPTVRKPSR